jgi:histidinol dehydrogenase
MQSVIQFAADRITSFHQKQIVAGFQFTDELGNTLGQVVRPLERVGIYVPGGRAVYPSTLLMNAIPARVAGVNEIIVVNPTPNGTPSPAVLAAATICGADRMFRIGGAQAISALAFGTQSIPAVDKIVGPGNIYVATAKRLLYGVVDIDIIAGPSEILIISDGSGDPTFAAADLLSQAEHDPFSASILITTSAPFADAVKDELTKQISLLPRSEIAQDSLKQYGALIVSRDLTEALSIANDIAPEHLQLMVENPYDLIDSVKNAGALFIGSRSSESIGDYVAGPNHVLPTGGCARFSSPLGVYDFVKRMSIVEISDEGLQTLGPRAMDFASLEGLSAHRRAVEVRLDRSKKNRNRKK